MILTKKDYLKFTLVVGATASMAFLLYKLYKIGRDMDKRKITDIEYEIHRDAVRQENRQEVEPVVTHEERVTEALTASQRHSEPLNPMIDPSEPPDEEEDLPYFDPEVNTEIDVDGETQDYDTPMPPMHHEPDINSKEMEKLRFGKDTDEALEQYKRMMLAGFDTETNTYKTLRRLFNTPFEASNDEDDSIVQRIMDRRADFFGDDSKWITKCTMADVILDYASMADYDMDHGVEYWAGRIVDPLGFNYRSPNSVIELGCDQIMDCTYEHELGQRVVHGLFALDIHDMSKGENESITQQYWDWSGIVVNEF